MDICVSPTKGPWAVYYVPWTWASIGRARADNPGEMLFCNKGVLEHRLVGHETYDHRLERWRHKVEDDYARREE
jgi:hypothetical protein